MREGLRSLLFIGILVSLPGMGFAAAEPIEKDAGRRIQIHPLESGQDLVWVSQHYYGTAQFDSVLMRYNQLPSTTPEPGTRVRIPRSPTHTVEAGDTWSELSARYWKLPSAAGALAHMNGRSLQEPLRVGERVTLPILVPVTLGRGQTLASIARELYGKTEFWKLLQTVNRIERPRKLRPGSRIVAPVILERSEAQEPAVVVPGTADLEADPGKAFEANPQADPAHELEAGIDAYLQGDYARALESLESARSDIMTRGSARQQRSLLRHLGFSYVAYDRREPACSAFRDLASVSPGDGGSAGWDPELISPKILATLHSCQGL